MQESGPEETTAARLLDVAAARFKEKGYAATTTRELAALLGVQHASLYHHIAKKEDLLYALCVQSLTSMHQAVAVAVAERTAALDRLRALIETHMLVGAADEHRHATMLFELRALSEARRAEVLRLRDGYEGLVRQVIAEAQEAGALRRDVPAKQLGLALLSLLNWSIVWFRPDGELSAAEVAQLFLTLFLDGARAPNGATQPSGDR